VTTPLPAPPTPAARPKPGRADWLRDRPPHLYRLGDETLVVRVRESTRARTARIVLGPSRPLEVIMPVGMNDAEVGALLDHKRSWIRQKVEASRAIAQRPRELGLDRAGVVWLAGAAASVTRRPGRRPSATFDGTTLVVCGRDDEARDAIVRWYRREARRRIRDVVRREAARLHVAYRSAAVRDQRTRWGSCSRHGNLSFSWRLVAAPSEVLEYVVVHELCHLKEPRHSKRFRRLLDLARPDWRAQACWLRAHGAELHEYVPRP
jgi:predicted metal-dependent hydrolase